MFVQNLAFNSGWHDPAWRRFVGRWALVSGLLVALTCHFSYDFFQFDEYYQVTEFVSFKLGKTPERSLAWEYHSEIRPWLQPAVYYAIARGLNLVGVENPFTLAEAFRFASGACAWAAIVSLMLSARVLFDDDVRRRWSVVILATLFILPYLAARTSSEAVSGSLFSLGFAVLMLGSAWRRGMEMGGEELAGDTPHPRPLSRKGRGESGRLFGMFGFGAGGQRGAVGGDFVPTFEANCIVVDVDVGMRLAEMEFVALDAVAFEPLERRGALAGDHLAHIAAACLHVPRGVKNDVMAGTPQRLELFNRAGDGLHVGIALPRLAELANDAV
jgi:Alg9-like mannosyltransferase family